MLPRWTICGRPRPTSKRRLLRKRRNSGAHRAPDRPVSAHHGGGLLRGRENAGARDLRVVRAAASPTAEFCDRGRAGAGGGVPANAAIFGRRNRVAAEAAAVRTG